MKNKLFQTHIKDYNKMSENDRFWLGGIYYMSNAGIEHYKPYKFNLDILFELAGTTEKINLEFVLISQGKMIEITVSESDFYKYFVLSEKATQETYNIK